MLLGGAWWPDLPIFLNNFLGHPAGVLVGLPWLPERGTTILG